MKVGGFVDRARQRAYESSYDQAETAAAELEKFRRLGFDFDRAVERLDEVLAGLGEPRFSAQEGMASIHWVLFACVAQRYEVRRILEIGTFDGGTTRLLSQLFPEARIVTLELPDDDPIFADTYEREDPANRRAFLERLAENTAGPNIELIKANSIFVPSLKLEPFDLIWVDGSHLYPEVAWDICSTYELCRPGGVLMADDILPDPRAPHFGYDGPDGYEVLEYLVARVEDPITYFMKRYAPLWSANPRRRKYVALLQKG